jgi:hypothetical protein
LGVAGALGASACVGEVDDDMTQGFTGIPGAVPWKMWGSSEVVSVQSTGAGGTQVVEQLASIQYRRPETWRFFLFARLLSGPTAIPAGNITCNFQLTTGVGRNIWNSSPGNPSSTGANFGQFVWVIPGGATPGLLTSDSKYTSQVRTPLTNDGDATSFRFLDQFVAETIQCSALLICATPAVGIFRLQVGAFFAPNTHVRPDWFAAREQMKFRGAETGGT